MQSFKNKLKWNTEKHLINFLKDKYNKKYVTIVKQRVKCKTLNPFITIIMLDVNELNTLIKKQRMSG